MGESKVVREFSATQELCRSLIIAPFPSGSHRLFLFYSESRKSATPGGDVKLMTSQDCGKSWSEPRLILAHEAQGGVPKVTANALVVGSDRTWYLPGERRRGEASRERRAR